MGDRFSYALQCAAVGALAGVAGVVLRLYFLPIDFTLGLPPSLGYVAGPLVAGLLGWALAWFSSVMIEKNEARLNPLRTVILYSLIIDGLMLGLFLH